MADTRGTSIHPDQRLRAIAAQQRGLFTRAQARNAGLTHRQIAYRVKSGSFERVLPGVYRIAGSAHDPWERMLAATLWAGRQSVISYRSAAVVWELDDVRAGRVEITIERPRQLVHEWVRVHHVTELTAVDRTVRDGLRVTSIERTLIDLSAVLARDVLEVAMESALRRRLTTAPRLMTRVDWLSARGRKGLGQLRELLANRETAARPSGSTPEVRLSQLLERAGLPKPVRQHEVRLDGNRFLFDVAYPSHMIGIEYESDRWHTGRAAHIRDRRRHYLLSSAGWRVLPVTREELRADAPSLVAALRIALGPDLGGLADLQCP